MKKVMLLLGKITFFLLALAVFSLPALIVFTLGHEGVAGGPTRPYNTDFVSRLVYVAVIVVPLAILFLLGWALFTKRPPKQN